jgi:hypothetical protein
MARTKSGLKSCGEKSSTSIAAPRTRAVILSAIIVAISPPGIVPRRYTVYVSGRFRTVGKMVSREAKKLRRRARKMGPGGACYWGPLKSPSDPSLAGAAARKCEPVHNRDWV